MARRGSTTRVPVALPEGESAAHSWLRGIRPSSFTLTVLALVTAGIFVLAPGLKVLVEQRAEIAALERERDEARQTVKQLEEEVDRWRDPTFLKAQARERLHYVFPGDITYLVIDEGEPSAPDGGLPISDEIQSSEIDWVRSMLSSVMAAGLADVDPDDIQSPVLSD